MSKQKPSIQNWQLTSYLSAANASYIEELYDQFLQNPNNVNSEWQAYFNSLKNGQVDAGPLQDISHYQIQEEFRRLARQPKMMTAGVATAPRQEAVDQLIIAYRRFGHLNANINPLLIPV